jgi:hypothetical protein
MSRPQKMHKPLKGDFFDIIKAVADGKGVKQLPKPLEASRATRSKDITPPAEQKKTKKK